MERMEDKKFVWLLSGTIFYDPISFPYMDYGSPKATLWRGDRSTAKEWPGNEGTLNNSEQHATLTNRRYE